MSHDSHRCLAFTVTATSRLQGTELSLFIGKLGRKRASTAVAREAEARSRDGEFAAERGREDFEDNGTEQREIGTDDADVAFDIYPDCGVDYVPLPSMLDLEVRPGKSQDLQLRSLVLI